MNPVARALEVFSEAVARTGKERTAFLDAACTDNAQLRTLVERMLRADAGDGDFLNAPFVSVGSDRSGERIGAYRLDALVGSGGMGSVYRASRADAAFDKPVAIKLLAFDAGDLRERFAREQRILGHLRHPHIANLLDVGTDAHGAPFLVMEFIDGAPVTGYAREHALDTRARVKLLLPAIDAVQDAHDHLIVHRDIKPGNVLVDEHGSAKLLDFGIARMLDDTDIAARTRTGLAPLTPEYASPEQVRGERAGVASDIYSLGVMLYELVTERLPYDFPDHRASTIERVICDTWPAAPSTLPEVRKEGMNRDLDAVLLRALDKTPSKRYRSCADFAADLHCWLRGDAVQARTPTRAERALRYARRHRFNVASAAAVAIALIAGSAIALWQAHIAREQARIATYQRDRAQRVNRFLGETLAAANPANLGRKATIVEALEHARKLASKEFADDPASAFSTQLALSRTYRSLGDYSTARDCGVAALQAAQKAHDDAAIIDAHFALGSAQFDLGDYATARASFVAARSEALAHGTRLQQGSAASELGQIDNLQGKMREAVIWFDTALKELPANAAEERAATLNGYGYNLGMTGDGAGAAQRYREAIATLAGGFPQGHPSLISYRGNLAVALRQQKQYDEASHILLDQVLPAQIEQLGENHPDVIWTLGTLAVIERDRGNDARALDYARQMYDKSQYLPDENEWKGYAYDRYGTALINTAQYAEAVPVLRRAVELCKVESPTDSEDVGFAESALGRALSETGARAEGEPLAHAAYARLLDKYGANNSFTILAKENLDHIAALPAQ